MNNGRPEPPDAPALILPARVGEAQSAVSTTLPLGTEPVIRPARGRNRWAEPDGRLRRPSTALPAPTQEGRAIVPLNLFIFPTCSRHRGLRKSVRRAYIRTILVIFDGNRLRPAGGWSARRIYHDGPAPYAEGDRSLAG